MTLVVTHAKVSAVANDPAAIAAGEVDPSDWNANHTIDLTGGLSFSTTANSNTKALDITQSGPTSGSVAGPLNLNLINITGYNAATTAGTNFGDAGAWTSAITGFRVNFTIGGANLGSIANQSEPFMGLMGHIRLTTASTPPSGADFEGVTGMSYVNVSAPNANMEGVVGAAIADGASASVNSISGLFAEPDIINGATVSQRAGVRISNLGTAQATTDAAIWTGSGDINGSFKVWSYFNTGGGAAPIATTGDVFKAGGAMTVANFANLSNMTVSGNILGFPNVTMQGNGLTNLGNSSAPDAGLTVNLNNGASSAPSSTSFVHVVAADSTIGGFEADTYGAIPAIILRRADGTRASKSAVASASDVWSVLAQSWDGSAYNTIAGIRLLTFNAQTGSDHSSQILLRTTPSGSTTIATAMTVQPSGGISIGTATDGGIGTVWANKSITAHNATAIPAGGTAGAGFMLSSTSNFGIFFGSSTPTLSAAKGSLYLRSDGSSSSTRAYINTDGGTTWTSITTAA